MQHFNLRKYQVECVDKLRNDLRKGKRELLVHAPCSFGKTIVFCYLAQKISTNHKSIVIVVDSINLVIQTKDKLSNFVSPSEIDICCGSLKEKNYTKKIIIGTIQTLKNVSIPFIDFLIFDEVHDGLSRIERFAKKEQFAKSVKIGFTATPFHANGVAMYGPTKFFKEVNYKCNIHDLIIDGFLVPAIYQEQSEESKIDLSNVKKNNFGEYSEDELQKTYSDNFQKVLLQLEDMKEKSKNRNKIVIMATGILHATFINASLENSVMFHSGISQEERFENLEKFKNGNARYLVGVSAIYKGLDIPCVDCLVMMRPTRSYPFYIQFVGRGARPFEGKENFLFLDYGEVLKELGFYDEFKEFKSKKVASKKKEKTLSKVCKSCLILNKLSAKICLSCKAKFIADEHLEKVDNTTLKSEISKEENPRWYEPFSYSVKKDVLSSNNNLMDIVILQESLFKKPIKIYLTHGRFHKKYREGIHEAFSKEVKKVLLEKSGSFYKLMKVEVNA